MFLKPIENVCVLIIAPSGAPTITAAYNLSSQEIFVSWQPPSPERLNGKVRKYQLRIQEVNAQPTTPPTSKSSVPSAVSSIVLSVPSSSSLPAPSTPVPTTPSGNGFPVTEPLEPPSEAEGLRLLVGSPVDVGLVLSYQVSSLKKWTAYEVEVRAVTVTPGPFSKKVTVQTDEDGESFLW